MKIGSHNDKTHTILLIAEDEFAIDDKIYGSVAKIYTEAIKRVIGLKRVASDDLSRTLHPRVCFMEKEDVSRDKPASWLSGLSQS